MSRFSKISITFLIIMLIVESSSLTLGWIPEHIMANFDQYIIMLLPVLIIAFSQKIDLKERFKLKGFKPVTILYCIILVFAIFPVTYSLSQLSTFIFGENPLGIEAYTSSLEGNYMSKLFVLAITPAICEEVLFRGLLLDRKIGLNIHILALLNGLMFSMFHVGFDQLLYTFPIGMIFAYITIITGSILPAMLIHFMNNSMGITLELLLNLMGSDTDLPQSATLVETSPNLLVDLGLGMGGLIIIVMIIRRLIRLYDYKDSERLAEAKEDYNRFKLDSIFMKYAPLITVGIFVLLYNSLILLLT